MAQEFQVQQPNAGNPLDDTHAQQDLFKSAEEVKCGLTDMENYEAYVVFGSGRASIPVSRTTFEEITAAKVDRTIDITKQVLKMAKENGVSNIDEVLLVGGMSKMPVIARRIKEACGLDTQLADPDLSVAKGAALFAQKKELERIVISRLRKDGKLGESAAIADADPGDLRAAARRAGREHGLTTTAVTNLVQMEISQSVSRSIGVTLLNTNTGELYVDFLTHATETLPLTAKRTYGTVEPGQRKIEIEVVEQDSLVESERPKDNRRLVIGTLGDIPAGRPANEPIEITFDMAQDKTLQLVARHKDIDEPLELRAQAGHGEHMTAN